MWHVPPCGDFQNFIIMNLNTCSVIWKWRSGRTHTHGICDVTSLHLFKRRKV